MKFEEYWATLCESSEDGELNTPSETSDSDHVVSDDHSDSAEKTDNTEKSSTEEPTSESENQNVHFALAATIRNGLFKKDDNIFICQIGATNQEGKMISSIHLQENDCDKTFWDNSGFEFSGYDPEKDNDWDFIENFAKCGNNAKILRTIKDHYGNRFRTFHIQEYFPNEVNDTFIDHIDPSMMSGMKPLIKK